MHDGNDLQPENRSNDVDHVLVNIDKEVHTVDTSVNDRSSESLELSADIEEQRHVTLTDFEKKNISTNSSKIGQGSSRLRSVTGGAVSGIGVPEDEGEYRKSVYMLYWSTQHNLVKITSAIKNLILRVTLVVVLIKKFKR